MWEIVPLPVLILTGVAFVSSLFLRSKSNVVRTPRVSNDLASLNPIMVPKGYGFQAYLISFLQKLSSFLIAIGAFSILGMGIWVYLMVPPDPTMGHSVYFLFAHAPSGLMILTAFAFQSVGMHFCFSGESKIGTELLSSASFVAIAAIFFTVITGSIWGYQVWGTYFLMTPFTIATLAMLLFNFLLAFFAGAPRFVFILFAWMGSGICLLSMLATPDIFQTLHRTPFETTVSVFDNKRTYLSEIYALPLFLGMLGSTAIAIGIICRKPVLVIEPRHKRPAAPLKVGRTPSRWKRIFATSSLELPAYPGKRRGSKRSLNSPMTTTDRVILALLVIPLIVGTDQLTKFLIVNEAALNAIGCLDWTQRCGQIEVSSFLDLTMVWNRGPSAVEPLSTDQMRLGLVVITLAMVLALGVWLSITSRKLIAFALALVIGGATGNLIDRINYGAIIDFIDLSGIWRPYFFNYVFNVADACIVVGAAVMTFVEFLAPDEFSPPQIVISDRPNR